jgi:hypothetical protein
VRLHGLDGLLRFAEGGVHPRDHPGVGLHLVLDTASEGAVSQSPPAEEAQV